MIVGVWAMGAVVLQPAHAQPQESASPELKKQYDEAFEETLTKPADLDVLFKYAGLANQMGDYEGAISALERMLLINPTCRGCASSSASFTSSWDPTRRHGRISKPP
jgi:hypothetical protein